MVFSKLTLSCALQHKPSICDKKAKTGDKVAVHYSVSGTACIVVSHNVAISS